MAVAVLIPWRSGCPHREAAWQWVSNQYATHHPTWQVVTGSCPEGPWVKALAVADALERTNADTLIVADADVWVDELGPAVTELDRAPWVVPHGLVHRLDEPSTAAVLAGGPLGGSLTQRPYRGHPGGGIVILTRSLYERVPLDPRFQGWGQEDDAWAVALRRIAGRPRRRNRTLWHLWHPPQGRTTRVIGSDDNAALFARYRAARNPTLMADLLEEVTDGRADQPHPIRNAGPAALR